MIDCAYTVRDTWSVVRFVKCSHLIKVRVLVGYTFHENNTGKMSTLGTPYLANSSNGYECVDHSVTSILGVSGTGISGVP